MTEEGKTAAFPDPGTIDFNQPILDLNDKPLPTRDGDDEITLTLGNACCAALLATLRDDKADSVQKLNRFNLARKLQGSVDDESWAVVKLNSKKKKMILDMAAQVWPTLIYARIHEALEGTTTEDEE